MARIHLFESSNKEGYINSLKIAVDEQFELINTKPITLLKKAFAKFYVLLKHTFDIQKTRKPKLNSSSISAKG